MCEAEQREKKNFHLQPRISSLLISNTNKQNKQMLQNNMLACNAMSPLLLIIPRALVNNQAANQHTLAILLTECFVPSFHSCA